MVLDEGGVIGDGILPGVSAPVAMVGVAEKGFLTLELITHTMGGHSSLPPRQTAIGVLSAAIARVEDNPMPARFEGATRQLFERTGRHFPFPQRAVFANLWLTRPLIIRELESSPATNAMVRTTTAPTIFKAGTKDNVLPNQARAMINFRILPGDTAAGVIDYVRRVINDSRVEVRRGGRFSAEPSTVSSIRSESFRALERTIQSVNPDVIVAPYLVVVVTDSRYYANLGNNVFRFLPIRLTSRDLERMHGSGERIAVGNYERAIRTYRQLLINATGR
jgi:carboxypeptidase PM20D1